MRWSSSDADAIGDLTAAGDVVCRCRRDAFGRTAAEGGSGSRGATGHRNRAGGSAIGSERWPHSLAGGGPSELGDGRESERDRWLATAEAGADSSGARGAE